MFFLIFNSHLIVFGQENLIGNYESISKGKVLSLFKDRTFLLKKNTNFENLLPVWEIDTISYGSWKLDDKFILLNSPDSISNSIMRLDVEEFVKSNIDTLYISISNQYETFFRNIGGKRVFKYLIYIDSRDDSIENEILLNDNLLKIHFPVTDKIYGVKVWMIPDPYIFPGRLEFNYLQTEYTSLRSPESNFLKLSIPNFTLSYINFIRLSNEYVIHKNDKIIFRGEVFKKSN